MKSNTERYTSIYTHKAHCRNTALRTKLSVIAGAVMLASACAGPETANHTEQSDEVNRQSQQIKRETHAQDTALKATQLPAQIPIIEADSTVNAELRERVQEERIVVTGLRTEQDTMQANMQAMPIVRQPPIEHYTKHPSNTETYQNIEENAVKLASLAPVSTFSIDVDTGSYSNARRMLTQGILPPQDAIRTEEFINYFNFDYPIPEDTSQPFSVTTNIAHAPWNAHRQLIRIGLQAYTPAPSESAGSNLVFLLDVSGSMNSPDKLPLLKRSLTILTQQLTEQDKVSIVVYAGASGVVLEPTQGNDTFAISAALAQLQAGGSTNGSAGIQQAYHLAEKAFIEGGVNRVILATDGDFNVGMVDHNALIKLIEQKREKGIALTTLGFGQGNYNDYLMEQLADAGNGNYAYIDTINEARKVLVDELQSTMQIVAKDVKIQVEFNPALVSEYRLIGYENRALANEDFNNDKVDAGEIGAGHSVTALYEISLVGSQGRYNDTLRYGNASAASAQKQQAKTTETPDSARMSELAHVKLRYKAPESEQSQLIEYIIKKDEISEFAEQGQDYQFAAAVAGFAQKVSASKYADEISYDWIVDTAQKNRGKDDFGYRSEFIQLVKNAQSLNRLNAKR